MPLLCDPLFFGHSVYVIRTVFQKMYIPFVIEKFCKTGYLPTFVSFVQQLQFVFYNQIKGAGWHIIAWQVSWSKD